MKEKFQEILDDLVGRFRNPLITSFILVWLYFHWSLLYQILNFDSYLNYQQKLFLVKLYVKQMGWQGMIGNPLAWSFVSLISYYLIGIIAQFFRVLLGKRLYAQVLIMFDKGRFVEKTELTIEKVKRRELQQELDNTKDSHSRLVNEKSKLETDLRNTEDSLRTISNRLSEAEQNILNNHKFIEKKENTLLYLLCKTYNISSVEFTQSDVQLLRYDIIEGNWDCYAGTRLEKRTGQFSSYLFSNDALVDKNAKRIATVKDLIYDRGLGLISFKLYYLTTEQIQSFYLIYLTKDEYIGFRDFEIISWTRAFRL